MKAVSIPIGQLKMWADTLGEIRVACHARTIYDRRRGKRDEGMELCRETASFIEQEIRNMTYTESEGE